jgi:hypothetical protein
VKARSVPAVQRIAVDADEGAVRRLMFHVIAIVVHRGGLLRLIAGEQARERRQQAKRPDCRFHVHTCILMQRYEQISFQVVTGVTVGI